MADAPQFVASGSGDTLILLPDEQPFTDAAQSDIWLVQLTQDYSELT